MSVPTELVKQLREISGAPLLECKKALEEAEGDLEKAFKVLRKRGQAAAAKEGRPRDLRRCRGGLYPCRWKDGRAGGG